MPSSQPGMLQFWIMALHLLYLKKSTKKPIIILDELGELQHRVVQQLNVFWDSNSTESGEHTFHTHLHENNHAEQD